MFKYILVLCCIPCFLSAQVEDKVLQDYLMWCMGNMREKMTHYDAYPSSYYQGRLEAYEHIYIQLIYWQTHD